MPDVRIEPQPDQNLYSFSRVVLKDVHVSRGVLDHSYPGGTIGAPCLIVQGTVRNMDPDSGYVTMFAYGYDDLGRRVAETLDVGEGIPGQITAHIEYGKTASFVLHVEASAETESVRLFAFTYAGNPPS